MQVEFRTEKLRKCFEKQALAEKSWPAPVGMRYIQRIQIIQEARSFEDVKAIPMLRVHPLKGNRDGQWSIKLNGKYRLVVELSPDEASVIVYVIEVSNHYGD